MMTMVKMFELVPHSLKLFILRVIKFLVYAVFYILSYVFCSVRYSLKMERDVLKKIYPPSYWLAAHNDCTHPTYSVLLLLLLYITAATTMNPINWNSHLLYKKQTLADGWMLLIFHSPIFNYKTISGLGYIWVFPFIYISGI